MTSVLTNTTAMSAMSALAVTQRSLSRTQSEISSGLKIASAKDDAAYWSIATSMKTRIGELQAVNDGLDLTAAILSTTSTAMTQIVGLMQGIAADLVTAATPGVDLGKVQLDISSKQQAIIQAAESATYNGVNWLVTRVTGTTSETLNHTFDASSSYVSNITYNPRTQVYEASAAGTFNEGYDDTYYTSITQTLGSTSSSTHTEHYANGVINWLSNTDPSAPSGFSYDNTNATLPTVTVTDTGDSTGYLHTDVPYSIEDGGNLLTSSIDLTPLQLFKTFTGPDTTHIVDTFTPTGEIGTYDVTTTNAITPYLNIGQSTVLSNTSFTTRGRPESQDPLLFDLTGPRPSTAAESKIVNAAIENLISGQSKLAALQTQVDGAKTINSVIIDALKSGVGALVDADMNSDATRLSALQTQQQLGIQALSVANDNSHAILKLFAA